MIRKSSKINEANTPQFSQKILGKYETNQVKFNKKSQIADERLHRRLKITQKAIESGKFSELTEFEILDYTLSFIIPIGEITNISNKLITKYGSIYQIIENPNEIALYLTPSLSKIAEFLSLIRFLARARVRTQVHESPIFKDGNQLREYLVTTMGRSRYEHLRVLYLDAAGCLIADEELNEPTLAVATIPFHKILRHAILRESSGFILVRNMHSNDVKLNKYGITAIQQLHDFCRIISLELLDFLIIRGEDIESLFESGLVRG